MRVKNLVARAGGIIAEPDTLRGQILRTTSTGDLQVLFFNPADALRGQSRDNVRLHVGDRVVIYTVRRDDTAVQPIPAEFSRIEQQMAGRVPDADLRLRQFGYDLFTPTVQTIPETPAPSPVEGALERRPSSALQSRGITAGLDALRRERQPVAGRRTPGLPGEQQRFGEPVGDLRFLPPVTDVPVGPDYIIGPGDNLSIVLWGGVEDFYEVEVNRNGAIVLPRLGVVQVGGITLERLEQLLRQRFGQYYPNFQMAVTLGRLRTIRVYVVGEVQQPGAYTVSSLSTVLTALFASGGPTKNGSLRQIRLLRQGTVLQTLDAYDFLLQGDKSRDQALQSGDTILVPVIGPVVGIAGNVRRPAIYEIEPGMTLQRLLEFAGGVTPLANLQRVHVERFEANTRKIVVDFNLSTSPTAAGSLWQTPIQDGDFVRVFPVHTQLENIVRLEGHVIRPGRYELKPGMRLRDLISSYDVLQPEAYFDYAEIVRQVEPDGHRRVVSFNLGALLQGEATHNLALHPRDTVRIFARDAFVDPGLVRISGLVHRPGIYALTDDMHVRDLVLRAGNVHKFAYLGNAELTRRELDVNGGLTTRVEINLQKALAGDVEHNLRLQDYDHLLVRQVPGVDLQREQPALDSVRLDRARMTVTSVRPETERLESLQRPTFFPLQEDDAEAVAVLRRAGIVRESTVELQGEVRFPGVYPILKGERLSSVLRRAGGYTDRAYLRGAVFTRESVREAQEKRLQDLIQEEEQALLTASAAEAGAALSTEEIQGQQAAITFRQTLLERIRAVKPEGRMVIRLQPLDGFAGSSQDIELESGDRLTVPQVSKYINVAGQVYNRTALIYEPGKDVGYYLDKVGGVKPQANKKELFVVQSDGTVVSRTQDQYAVIQADGRTTYVGDFFAIQPQPGDTIVVPSKIKTPPRLRATRDIVQIIFQSIGTLGVVLALL
jgi:protein involved in polysaccharide export with SLBB domain